MATVAVPATSFAVKNRPLTSGDAHGGEVIGAAGLEQAHRAGLARLRQRLTFGDDGRLRAAAFERQRAVEAGGGDPRDRRHRGAPDRRETRASATASRILRGRQRDRASSRRSRASNPGRLAISLAKLRIMSPAPTSSDERQRDLRSPAPTGIAGTARGRPPRRSASRRRRRSAPTRREAPARGRRGCPSRSTAQPANANTRRVDRHQIDPRNRRRPRRHEQPTIHHASSTPKRAADHRQQQALGEQLLDDAAALGAERGAQARSRAGAARPARASGWRDWRSRSAARTRRRRGAPAASA